MQGSMTAEELQKQMIKLNMTGNQGFEVLRNYVQPIFKIEKVPHNLSL